MSFSLRQQTCDGQSLTVRWEANMTRNTLSMIAAVGVLVAWFAAPTSAQSIDPNFYYKLSTRRCLSGAGLPIIAVTIANDHPHLLRGRFSRQRNLAVEALCIVCLSGPATEQFVLRADHRRRRVSATVFRTAQDATAFKQRFANASERRAVAGGH
jgi:hypothetical protein